ncbi:MAG: GIY-YIG nuclease family protein [Thaumarchaeota archaeon]|nr:GIY-YIG nuclease family protein [Nitrososphaerota archaeon]
MNSHYVYVVRCSDGTLYTGYTTDPERRVKEHNRGKGGRYTMGRAPVKMVYLQRLKGRLDALRREASLKKMSREAKLALCRGYVRSSR